MKEKKEAIIIHCQEPKFVYCELCDVEGSYVDSYFQYVKSHEDGFEILGKALHCCEIRLNVTDWGFE